MRDEQTDFWRETDYGFIRQNGHADGQSMIAQIAELRLTDGQVPGGRGKTGTAIADLSSRTVNTIEPRGISRG